jgi:diguanylate cyclase (GGDEF)-like protein
MDPKTVIFLLSLNLISIGGLLILIGRRMPEPAGLRGFATGALVFGCAYLLRLALGYTSSAALTVVADAGMVFSTLCFASGMLQFSGRPPIRSAVLAACVGSYAALASAAIVAWPEGGRHVAINLFLGGAYIGLGALALAGARRETRTLATPMRVLALLVGVLGLATFARGVGVLTGGAEFLYSGLASQAYYAYGAVVTVMLGPNLLWMVFVRLNDRLALLATRDPLTQLLNRNGLDEVVQRHFGARPLRPLVLMQVDVDHFKRVNDSHGHAVGDAVLRAVADTLASHVRGGDFIARLGGEEFLVGCVGADIAQARQLAERLRLAVSGCRHALADGGTVACTVSIGVSGVLIDRAGWEAALRQADRALYAAKAAGRDRVETAPAEASEPGPNP